MNEALQKWFDDRPEGIAAVVVTPTTNHLVLPHDFETSDQSGQVSWKAMCASLIVSDRFKSLREHLMEVIELIAEEPDGDASA